jgi:hypothetical protein
MMKWMTLLALGFSLAAQAQKLDYDSGATPFLRSEVAAAMALLPAGYLPQNATILVRSTPLNNDQHIREEVICDPAAIHALDMKGSVFGQVRRTRRRHELTISTRLLELAQADASISCSHGSFRNILRATIIHELTHVKDNHEKISSDPDFQRIVGVRRDIWGRRKIISQNHQTSPDAYEFKNFEEALAVNVEWLVLDPEFECRKPATAGYLSRKLGIALAGKCAKNYQVMSQSAFLEDNYQHTLSIEPSRIYQVHYLFAGQGQAIMSRWGHAMFRLVVCAPHRKVAGPECLKDVSHHVALNYRAYVTDMNIDYLKGLKGQYPSQLFIMRYHEIQQEYTKYELRDLYSVPLRMTEEQKIEFLDLTLERYWTYQGRYYFIDNNCGTEAQKHLAVALDDEQSRLVRSITPQRIFKDIIKEENELASEAVKGVKREELISRGILMPSMFSEYNETYQFLRQHGIFREKNFRKFLKSHDAYTRHQIYQSYFAAHPAGEESRLLVMRLIHLERYLSTKFVQGLPKATVDKVKKDRSLREAIDQMGESMKMLATQPWEIIDSQYGAPLKSEFVTAYPRFLDQREEEMRTSNEKQMSDLQDLLGRPVFVRELREIEWLKEIRKMTNELFLSVMGVRL